MQLPSIDGNGEIETYEAWLERQLLSRIEKLEQLSIHSIVQASVSDEALAIEIIARFTGNSRGTPIAKKSFIDGVLWAKGRMASVASEGQGKAAD